MTACPRLLRFVAGLTTYDGADSAHLCFGCAQHRRYDGGSLTAEGVQVMVEEDTTWDSETGHTSEAVSHLVCVG